MEMNFSDDDLALVERLEKKRRRRRELVTAILILVGMAVLLYVTVIRRLPFGQEIAFERTALLVTDGNISETTVWITGRLDTYIGQEKRRFRGNIVIEGINDSFREREDMQALLPIAWDDSDIGSAAGSLTYRISNTEYAAIGNIRTRGAFEEFVIWNRDTSHGLPEFALVAPTDYPLAAFDTLMGADRSADFARGWILEWEFRRIKAEGLQ